GPDDTGSAAGPPTAPEAPGVPCMIGGDTAPGLCGTSDGGCAPAKFFGETTGWPIALRAVGGGIVVAPAWLGDGFPGLADFTLGLMIRICCCVTPRGGSTGGATAASASIGTSALLGAGRASLAPFPPAPFPLAALVAAPVRAPRCAWPSLAKHG